MSFAEPYILQMLNQFFIVRALILCLSYEYILYKTTSSLCRWITPVLLIIDFYEKMAVSSKRRAQMNKVKPNQNNRDILK